MVDLYWYFPEMPQKHCNRRTFINAGAGFMAAAYLTAKYPAYAKKSGVANSKWKTGYVYDERCLLHPHSPEVPERLLKIQEQMAATGLSQLVTPVQSLGDPYPLVKQVHTASHIDSIKAITHTGISAEAAIAGILGAVKGVSGGAVRNAFCAIRPPGHHAHNMGGEEGFCFYSNVAIAAKYAQSLGHAKVLIIDWDFHHGNGTEDVFYSDPSVLFFSTHSWQAYPGTGDPARRGEGEGQGYNINVDLPCRATDADILTAWLKQLSPAVETFKPDFILISAGFDSRQDDTLGCFDITDNGFAAMTKKAMEMADVHCGGRLVSVLEGGYNVDGVASAAVHHISALLGLDAPPLSIKKKRSGASNNKPVIRSGWIHFPPNLTGQVASISVHNKTGHKMYHIDVSQNKSHKIQLKRPTLPRGQYIAVISFKNGPGLSLPF